MQASQFCPKLRPVTVAVLTALSMVPPLSQAASPAPGAAVGNEFQVNTYTPYSQQIPRVAMDAAGDFAVTWQKQSYSNFRYTYDIYAQRYAADGTPVGTEFQVNTYSSNIQANQAIAMDAAGDFVIAWQTAPGSSGWEIHAQRYAADGTPTGSEFQVNTYTSGNQTNPAIAIDAAGDFVVTWVSYGQDGDSNGIFAQRYAASGAPDGSEFQVNTDTSLSQTMPAIAMDAMGNFTIAWQSNSQDLSGYSYGIYAQRYAAGGTPDGSEFEVYFTSPGEQAYPAIAMDATGDFVVTWASDVEDGSGSYEIYARRYTSNGIAAGSAFEVNTDTIYSHAFPAIAMDATGDFVVTWQGGSGGSNIHAQRYAPDGTAVGSAFQVNTYTSNSQARSTITMDAAGDSVVAWNSYGQDGNAYGIFAQRYARPSALDLAATLSLSPTGTVTAGEDETLTVGVTNTETVSTLTGNATIDAALNSAFGVTAALTLPSDVTFKSASGSNWACHSAPTGNVLTCTFAGTLAAASNSDQLTVTVATPTSDKTALDFSNAVSGNQPDTNSSNDTATASVTTAAASSSDNNSSSSSSSGGGGGFGLFSLVLLLPFTRRKRL